MRARTRSAGERGFSLIELLVAMFVTMIVSGAIYGLIASGQTAFRREPELAERQQNIRIAMDLIQRDVLLAGQGIPWFGQAFTNDDTALAPGGCGPGPGTLNGCGLTPGTLGGVAAAARNGDGESPDVLEMVAVEEQCPYLTICEADGGPNPIETAAEVVVREPSDGAPQACLQPLPGGSPQLLLATNNYNFSILRWTGTVSGNTCGGAGGANRSFTFAAPGPLGSWSPIALPVAQLLANPAGGNWLAQARVARYEIAPDPLDGAPSLWRSTTGLFSPDGVTPEGRAGAGIASWQLVARGVEDLQVEYMDGTGAWSNTPTVVGGGVACASANPLPTACPGEAPKLTVQVRVTLSARSMAPNMVGAVQDGNQTPGTEALRGQLQAIIAPRAAKVGLAVP